MLEAIEGRGKLEDWDVPKVQMPVVYRFQIRTEILNRAGFPPVAARKHSIGLVQTLSGDCISGEGYYRLFAEDGEILKVQNVGLGQWVILAS